ncbi:MAG: GGDEF domain-containing protein [Bacillota bacterium]|nr:GGDEF domain-containing protein [Bacillota bacterium]
MGCLLLLVLIGSVFFYRSISWDHWYMWVILMGLIIYLEFASADLNQTMIYSFSHSIAYPSLFLFGPMVSLFLFGLTGLIEGIVQKKSKTQITYNFSQSALGGMLSSIVFVSLGGATIGPWYYKALIMMIAIATFITLYLLLFATEHCLLSGPNLAICIKRVFSAHLYSNVGSGFIGIIFTLFIEAYELFGIIGFSLLLIYLSKLFEAAGKISREREARLELEEEVLIDEMTQVYNFRYLNNWLNDPKEEKVSVLFLDIDNFRIFNDLYGHAEGNRILKLVTDMIKKSVRETDSVIRYGGDEFVVLLPKQDKNQAHLIAQRILENISATSKIERKTVELSIGIASSPDDTIDKRQLLMLADQAMYTAKLGGKNRAHLSAT